MKVILTEIVSTAHNARSDHYQCQHHQHVTDHTDHSLTNLPTRSSATA